MVRGRKRRRRRRKRRRKKRKRRRKRKRRERGRGERERSFIIAYPISEVECDVCDWCAFEFLLHRNGLDDCEVD
jgi:hypothetical protein